MKKLYIFLTAFILPAMLWAQTVSTEAFEDETAGAVSFTDNGQVFNITSQVSGFDVYYGENLGWNGTGTDDFFIDNTGNTGAIGTDPVIEFTIATAGEAPFTLKSLWLYMAKTNLQAGAGTVTITGKHAGGTVFTASQSFNFSSVPTANNGYTKIDLGSYGGSDNSGTTIDEFMISTTGNLGYIALDALTWASVDIATPVQLADFTGFLQNNTAHFAWHTGLENRFDHFDIQKSVGADPYTTIESLKAKGNNSDYSYSVLQAEPSANYRLKMVDNNGKLSYSGQVTLSGEGGNGYPVVYPNPAHDFINVRAQKAGALRIYDAAGRQVKVAPLKAGVNLISIRALSAGIYYGKIGAGKVSFVKK